MVGMLVVLFVPLLLQYCTTTRYVVLGDPRPLWFSLCNTSTSHIFGQWSEDVIKGDTFFGRYWVRFRVPPWVSNTIARDHLA